MTRGLTSAIQNKLRDAVVYCIWLAEIEFDGLTLYLSTRRGDMSWNAQTWQGNSILQPPRSIRSTKDHVSMGVKLPLVGYDSTIMSLVLEDLDQSKKMKLYFGMLDENGALVDSPYMVFNGRFDTAQIQSSGEQREIVLSYENDFLQVKRVNSFRYTDMSQQALFDGDTGFQRAALAADWRGFWGATTRPLTMQRKKRNTAK